MKNKYNSEYKHNLMIQSISNWEKALIEIKKIIGDNKLNALDVGGAEGSSLIALHNVNMLNKGFLVDINLNYYFKEFLLDYKKNKTYYKKLGIKTFNLDGLDPKIPFSEAQLVIMTYNNGIMWKDLYPRLSKTQYFIAEDSWGEFLLNNPELELIHKFGLYPKETNKDWVRARNGDYKPYLLFRRK